MGGADVDDDALEVDLPKSDEEDGVPPRSAVASL